MSKSQTNNIVKAASELFDDEVKLNNKYNAYEMLGIKEPLTNISSISRKYTSLKTNLEKEISTANRQDAALYQSVIRDYDIAFQILSDPAARRKNDLHNGYGEEYLRDRPIEVTMHGTQAEVVAARSNLRKTTRSTSIDSLGSTDSEKSTRSNSSVSTLEAILAKNAGAEITSTLKQHQVTHLPTSDDSVVTSIRDRVKALNAASNKKSVVKR